MGAAWTLLAQARGQQADEEILMKFTDGFWRNLENMKVFNAFKVYDYERDERSVTLYAPYSDVVHRGQTLEGPVLTVRLSSPFDEVIRVQVWHYKGALEKLPRFELEENTDAAVQISIDPESALLRAGNLAARARLDGSWHLSFESGGESLVNSSTKNLGYVIASDDSRYMKEQLSLSVGELVYGLGERFTPFVKNGQVAESWNADGGTSSELSYKAVPFYMTNRGYGVFVNDPGALSYEIGSEKVARVQFSVPGEYLEYYIINGPDPKTILERYTRLTGKPALPPAWSFGLWLTTSFVTEYDEKTVSAFIDGMAERGIPLSVFHFDCFWMKEYHWTDFAWNRKWFPDPEGFISRIRARGLKVCVWINPYIAQRSPLFEEGMAKGYLLKRRDGSVYQVDTWQPGMGFVDFTNPAAREWYKSYLVRLMDQGIEAFKTDFGERIPYDDLAWFDGSDPEKMHNFYSYLYNKAVFEAMEEKLGKGKGMLFARSASTGGQRFPVHWGGDCTASFESMAESLRGGLSLGLSGFGYWSHDISGFEMTATPALYKRWSAFGLLSSHSRLHGNASYRVPWLFDEEAVEVLRFFTRLKARLMPYLFSAAVEGQEGIPMMRAMFLEFPEDPACEYLDRQYMLGKSLLVAPVFSAATEVRFYLPEGKWTHILSGEIVNGGSWRTEQHGFQSLPLYVRNNSLIAWGKNEETTDYDFADGVEIVAYGLTDGIAASCTVYATDGSPELQLRVTRRGQSLEVEAGESAKPWSIRLHGSNKVHAGKAGRFSIGLEA